MNPKHQIFYYGFGYIFIKVFPLKFKQIPHFVNSSQHHIHLSSLSSSIPNKIIPITLTHSTLSVLGYFQFRNSNLKRFLKEHPPPPKKKKTKLFLTFLQ